MMRQRGDASGDDGRRIAAEREACGADPLPVDPRHEARVGQHAVDHRAQITRPLPPQREALDRIAVDRIVAQVVDRRCDIACPRAARCRAKPSSRRSRRCRATAGSAEIWPTPARVSSWRRRARHRKAGCHAAQAPAASRRRPDRRIPARCRQPVLRIAAPLVGLGRRELARAHAGLGRGLRSGLCDAESEHRYG